MRKSLFLWGIDVIALAVSFILAIVVRYSSLFDSTGGNSVLTLYSYCFLGALILYSVLFWLLWKIRFERLSSRELLTVTFEQQSIFAISYIVLVFLFHHAHVVSRIVICLFYIFSLLFCFGERLLYWHFCNKILIGEVNSTVNNGQLGVDASITRHCYIIGSKSIGQYGGYETFVLNLLQQHKDTENIVYHVACKANGSGHMDLSKLDGVERINDGEFSYCNAYGFLIHVPEKLGAAQAIYYDIKALQWACDHIEKNHVEEPIVYILASRVGPFERKYVRRIHSAGGVVFQNPDGHEDWRRKWAAPIRKYWKISERFSVKYADLVVCDSKNIETYIQDEYSQYHPNTTYIAYGSYITPSKLADDDVKYRKWLAEHNLRDKDFYVSVGRFVPENNFDIMIREFMLSNSKKSFAIITTENGKYARELQQKLQYKKDKRIKFVGTVYDQELLSKIRENAYGYFHGHEVGGTNPSLLEALGSTELNLLYGVGFNKEVAEEAALYWSKEVGDLAKLIDRVDLLPVEERKRMGEKAKERIRSAYSWEFICDRYMQEFMKPIDVLRRDFPKR